MLVGGPTYGKNESLTRSILNKIGREFTRFLRYPSDFYDGEGEKLWEWEKISHLEGIFFFFLMVERSLETDGNYIIGSERAAGPIVKSKIHASQTCDSPFPRLHLFINIHERRNYYNSPGYITIRFGNKRKKYGSNFSKRNEKNKNLFNFEFFERREMEFIYIYINCYLSFSKRFNIVKKKKKLTDGQINIRTFRQDRRNEGRNEIVAVCSIAVPRTA